MSHGTPSEIDGQYIQFQTEVLRQLPRPHALEQGVIEGWLSNRSALKESLHKALIPASASPDLRLFKKKVELGDLSSYREHHAFMELYRTGRVEGTAYATQILSPYWLESERKSVSATTLRVYQVAENIEVIDAYRSLGERYSSKWEDVYRLLEMQAPEERGYLSRHYSGNCFFIDSHFIRIVCNGLNKWVIVEQPIIPGDIQYHKIWRRSRIFVR